ERHDLEMVGPAMAGCVCGHVGEYDIGRAAKHGLDFVRGARIEKVALDEFDARHGRHWETIDRHDLPPPLRAADALRRDLAPAAGRRTQIDHPRPLLEQMVLVVDLDQLEGGAGAKTFALGARDVRVVELSFEPALRRRRTALARFEADLERALAGIRGHFDPTFGSDMALEPRPRPSQGVDPSPAHAPSSRIICTSIPSRSPRSATRNRGQGNARRIASRIAQPASTRSARSAPMQGLATRSS